MRSLLAVVFLLAIIVLVPACSRTPAEKPKDAPPDAPTKEQPKPKPGQIQYQ